MKTDGMKKLVKLRILLLLSLLLLNGCSTESKSAKGHTALPFTYVEDADLPAELKKEIEARKDEVFQITYGDMEFLYIAKGYGKKECSDYCIEFINCSENENTIFVNTTLHGPGGAGEVCQTEYAYYVIRVAYSEKKVIFEN